MVGRAGGGARRVRGQGARTLGGPAARLVRGQGARTLGGPVALQRPSPRRRHSALGGALGRAGLVLTALVVGLVLGSGSVAGAVQAPPPPPTRPPGQTLPPPTQPPGSPLPPPTARPPASNPAPTPTVPDADEPDGGNGVLVLAALVAAAVIGGVAAIGLRNRAETRRTQAAGPLAPPARNRTGDGPTPTSTAPPGPGALTHELLEVSRQLTAASVTGDVKRATVRGALSLVPADGAAIVAVDGETGQLSVAVESTAGLLVPDQLAGGVLGRVAETGDYVELISASEPAIRNRPACVLAMPLVASGRVAALLVVVRPKDQPFSPNEAKTLRALAPMAAAVLQSERHAQSAIEDSLVDPLTGANNRRRFDRDLDAALTTSGATAPVALAIIDLDHFKRVNDTHGHPAGDALLKAVVGAVQHAVRPGDGVYRFGGEEFCVLFTDTTAEDAHDVAERVRREIAARPYDVGAAEPLAATASIGVASTLPGTARDAADLLARADAALYAAKESGRNQVVAR